MANGNYQSYHFWATGETPQDARSFTEALYAEQERRRMEAVQPTGQFALQGAQFPQQVEPWGN